jgi:hypothetical protein
MGNKEETKHPDARTVDSARKKLGQLAEKNRRRSSKRSANEILINPPEAGDDPPNWRIRASERHIKLYLELLKRPRPLSAAEARMMVELVDGWRELEHRKHIALKNVGLFGLRGGITTETETS